MRCSTWRSTRATPCRTAARGGHQRQRYQAEVYGVSPKQAVGKTPGELLARANETILVTEDDAAVRRVAVRILTRLGYRTREASNGPEALEILGSEAKIDLLFTDIILTGVLNGAQLASKAQELRPGLKVLFASGYSEPAVLKEVKGADRVPLLNKRTSLAS